MIIIKDLLGCSLGKLKSLELDWIIHKHLGQGRHDGREQGKSSDYTGRRKMLGINIWNKQKTKEKFCMYKQICINRILEVVCYEYPKEQRRMMQFLARAVSARARISGKDRVCWGPLQTRKDTRQVLGSLYNCPFGIQVPKLVTRVQLEFPIRDNGGSQGFPYRKGYGTIVDKVYASSAEGCTL